MKSVLKNESGSSLIYVMVLAGLVGTGAMYFMRQNENLSKNLSRLDDRVQYDEVFSVLKNQLFDSATCTRMLLNQPINPGAGAEKAGLKMQGVKFDKFSGVLKNGLKINSVEIASITAVTKDKLRDVRLYSPAEDYEAFEIDLYIEPAGLSDAYSLQSESFFKKEYAIPLTVYAQGNKIKKCFGKGSSGDLCTKMGGAFTTEADPPLGVRCQPDVQCLTHQDGVTSSSTCSGAPYYQSSMVGSVYGSQKFICMWCPRAPASASSSTGSTGSTGGTGGGYSGGGSGGGGSGSAKFMLK